MYIRKTGDAEYHLLIEEKIRECTDAIYTLGKIPDNREFAVIVLKEPFNNKKDYSGVCIETGWEACNNRNKGIEKVFLTFNFKDVGVLKFYIDLYDKNFRFIKNRWFKNIIDTETIVISDRKEPSILADGVPLDIPEMIINFDKMKKGKIRKR